MTAIEVLFQGKPTQETLMEDIQKVEAAVVGNHKLHLSHNFTNSPGHAALVVCYATCADADAKELQQRLDTVVAEFRAERGVGRIEPSLAPQYSRSPNEVTTSRVHRYNEAGRRLQAAVVSFHMGYKGIDSTLKATPEVVDESWAELAAQLIRGILQENADRLLRPLKSNTIQ